MGKNMDFYMGFFRSLRRLCRYESERDASEYDDLAFVIRCVLNFGFSINIFILFIAVCPTQLSARSTLIICCFIRRIYRFCEYSLHSRFLVIDKHYV